MAKYSAMIVDDSNVDRYLLTRFLEQTQLIDNIFEAVDGQEAIDFMTEHYAKKEHAPEGFPPVILFLDINMPRMNGFEFLDHYQRLQDSDNTFPICVVMFTSSSAKEDVQRAFSYKCVKDYIEKGNYNVSIIKEKLSTCLKAHK